MEPLVEIPLAALRVNPEYEQRFPPISDTEFQRLLALARWSQVIDPIYVAPDPEGTYVILDGHIRYRLATALGFKTMRCYVVTDVMRQIAVLRMDLYNRSMSSEQVEECQQRIDALITQLEDRARQRRLNTNPALQQEELNNQKPTEEDAL